MVRVKICGITSPADAAAAADAGADAVGLVFAESPRRVTPARARAIVAELPPFVAAVGVFVNASPDDILRAADELNLAAVQLHGDEPPNLAEYLRARSDGRIALIKAFRPRDPRGLAPLRDFPADAMLLDGWNDRARGGTGAKADITLARRAAKMIPRLILAGGLTPANVAATVRAVRPWAVDVSSGVERSPGRKDAAHMKRFVANAKRGT
ncbi:MAG: phosphoribosylanthranilate isomerase [Planctomycetota bacterium]